MAKSIYTLEIACNAPAGIWRVKDRTFFDRRLTIGEKQRAWAAGTDMPILAAALTILKVEGEAVTEEWLIEALTEADVIMAFAFILGGSERVAKVLADNAAV